MGRAFLYLVGVLYVVPLAMTVPAGDTSSLALLAWVVCALAALFAASSWVRRRIRTCASIGTDFKVDLAIVLFVTACVAALALQGTRSVEVIRSVMDGTFFERGLEDAIERYEGTASVGTLENVSTAMFFVASGMLGLLARSLSRRAALLVYPLYFVCLLVNIADLSKASAVIGICFAAAAYLVINSEVIATDRALRIRGALGLVVAAIVLFAVVHGGRVQTADEPSAIVTEKAGAYVLAPYSAFWRWYQDWTGNRTHGYDTLTFAFKLVGGSVDAGFYDVVDTPYGSTNIYLNLRGIIEDFGEPIGVAVLFVGGILAVAGEALSPRRRFTWTFPVLLFALFPFISVFNFTTSAVGVSVFWIATRLVVRERSAVAAA